MQSNDPVTALSETQTPSIGSDTAVEMTAADLAIEAAVGGFRPLVDWSGVEEEQRRHLGAALVVGHRQRGRLARLGSTTYGVLHRAACPVAVVSLSR